MVSSNSKISVDKNTKNLNSTSISANRIDVDNLNADNIIVDYINVSNIIVNDITATNIYNVNTTINNSLLVNKIRATTISTDEIYTNIIDFDYMNGNYILVDNVKINNSLLVNNTIKTNSINSNAITINTSYISTLPHPVCFASLATSVPNATGLFLPYTMGQNAGMVINFERGISVSSSGLITILSDGIYEITTSYFVSNVVNASYNARNYIYKSDGTYSTSRQEISTKGAGASFTSYQNILLNCLVGETISSSINVYGGSADNLIIVGNSSGQFCTWISARKV